MNEPVATKAVATTTAEVIAANGEPAATEVETAATKISAPITKKAETPTEPDEDDRPKLPLWKAALKQKKEAETRKKEEEQKKLVSNLWQSLKILCDAFSKKKMIRSGRECLRGKENY